MGGLVERRMLQNPDADWLERAEIETVLRERELQSLMSPEACGERAAIGRLLKADMLILLRHFEEPKAQVQLVVCETKQGLRLAIHALAASGDVEADAERLSALVKNSIREHPREIREICAVPSFVSDDLAYDHDHLKAAYARLVEQTLRSRPGVLTAEVEEAHAIAQEVRLAGDEIQRRMPLYFLGSFRHAGERDRLTVTIRLTVKRGETDLADRRVENVSSADGAVFLQRAAQELIGQTLGTGPAAPDAQAEAKQLALLAEAAFAVGGWEDAAALAEASLLLDSASYESLPDRFPRPRLWAEPIEPGRALLVSYFGRMALATVTFSPASGAKVDVFFEARQQPDPTVLQAWFNPRLAFAPAYVFAFAHQSEQGPAERRVVIGGRSQPDDHPLVVDPGTREVRVQVFGLEQGIDASWHAVTQSAVYQLVCSGDLTRHLARVGLPKFRLEYLLSGVPAGRCVAYEGRILIAGQQWWQLDPQADPDHRIRLLTTSLPWTEPFIVSPRQATNQPGGSLSEAERYRLEMLCQSNHFGLLAVRRAEKPPNPCEFFRVVFQGPQTPSPPLATSR
ncbi:MAG: hypothetical protein MUF25_26350 [Pirellulaceae bacterium]|nr:hypothetical protein [Pirellulaceae bacterium]